MFFVNFTGTMVLLLACFVEAGFIAGAVAMWVANRRAAAGVRKSRWVKFGTYFLITHVMILSASMQRPVFIVLMAALILGSAVELTAAIIKRRFLDIKIPLAAYAAFVPAAAFTFVFAAGATPARAVYVYLIVCVLDAYSQLTGQLLGRQMLPSAISPNKTVEGALGGAFFAILAALVCRELAGFGPAEAFLCGLALSAAGIAGDLSSSRFKRLCSIKDYSRLLPGQGGILDRFNSFFAAAPVFLLFEVLR